MLEILDVESFPFVPNVMPGILKFRPRHQKMEVRERIWVFFQRKILNSRDGKRFHSRRLFRSPILQKYFGSLSDIFIPTCSSGFLAEGKLSF